MHAVFIRAPWVEEAGAGCRGARDGAAADAAGADAGAAAGRAVAVRQGAVLATAFHPELTGDLRVHALFCELVRDRRRGLTAAARCAAPVAGRTSRPACAR